MKQVKMKNLLIVLTIVSLIGIGTTAFAGWGRGNYGSGMHRGGWGQMGNPYFATNLSEADRKQFEASRQAFFEDTDALRRKIYEKELALQSELIKENPDTKVAVGIQKEISDLQSQFNQKRLAHRLEMQKTYPDAGRGYMGRGGWGKGHMGAGRMGRGNMGGGYGPGNCPWQ